VVKNDRGRIVGSHSAWTAIVDVDSSTMAASGGGRPVAEDYQRPAVALRLVGDHRDEPVQPPQRLTARGPLDVDALVVQQRAHPDGSQRRLGPQPPVSAWYVTIICSEMRSIYPKLPSRRQAMAARTIRASSDYRRASSRHQRRNSAWPKLPLGSWSMVPRCTASASAS
jgi:hypothetical protein